MKCLTYFLHRDRNVKIEKEWYAGGGGILVSKSFYSQKPWSFRYGSNVPHADCIYRSN